MSIHDDNGTTTRAAPATGIDPYSTLNRRRRGVRVTYAAAVALGLAIGGGAIAGAATGSTASTTQPADHPEGSGEHAGLGGSPPAAFGTVATVGADTFTITSHDGATVTVNVSGATTYVDPAVTTPSFTDVKVGDRVAVFGTDTNNTVAATRVAVGGMGGHGHGPGGLGEFGGSPPAAFGTVATVGADTFTITSHDGATVTVNVSGATTYVDPAVTTPSFTDVKVGDRVAVFGTDTNNTVAATRVAAGGMGGMGGMGGHGPGGLGRFGGTPPAAEGTVASVTANAFTLTTHDGTKVTVAVGTATTYKEFGKVSASITDVTVGAHVDVFGTDVNNSVTATQVAIAGTGGPGGPEGMGGADDSGVSAPSSSSATVPSGTSTSSTGSSSGSTLA